VGTISSAYDVSAAILGIVISYFGSGRSKPRLIAIAAVVMSIGSFMMALPHFTTGPYQWGQNTAEKCKGKHVLVVSNNIITSQHIELGKGNNISVRHWL